MVDWSCAAVAAFTGWSHRSSHPDRQRRRRLAGWHDNLLRCAPRHARLARDGLGCSAFHEPTVYACPPSHQFRNYTAVSFAPLRKGGTMNTKKIALLVLLGSMVVVPAAQAQIKHIEMRVEGMT